MFRFWIILWTRDPPDTGRLVVAGLITSWYCVHYTTLIVVLEYFLDSLLYTFSALFLFARALSIWLIALFNSAVKSDFSIFLYLPNTDTFRVYPITKSTLRLYNLGLSFITLSITFSVSAPIVLLGSSVYKLFHWCTSTWTFDMSLGWLTINTTDHLFSNLVMVKYVIVFWHPSQVILWLVASCGLYNTVVHNGLRVMIIELTFVVLVVYLMVL